MQEEVILVDEEDNEIGREEKLKAHQDGKLHRCFSIFVFNSKGELMLQRRARSKYHSGGLWTNTCCGHPRPGEGTLAAAHRRLMDEMGFDCDLEEIYQFTYRAELDHGLTEHEYDHVFSGAYEGEPVINPEEADQWKWVDPQDLFRDMERDPGLYTHWLRVSLKDVLKAVGC